MAKYVVEIKTVEVYYVPVESDTEKEAIDKALDLVEENPARYHDHSDGSERVLDEDEWE